MTEEKKSPTGGTVEPKGTYNSSLPHPVEKVNDFSTMIGDTRPMDIVSALRGRYPKFDRSMVSKLKKPEKYAVRLMPEAEKMLMDVLKIAPEAFAKPADDEQTAGLSKRSHESQRFPCRIYGRISEEDMMDLLKFIAEDGFPTVAAWVQSMVQVYLTTWRREHG